MGRRHVSARSAAFELPESASGLTPSDSVPGVELDSAGGWHASSMFLRVGLAAEVAGVLESAEIETIASNACAGPESERAPAVASRLTASPLLLDHISNLPCLAQQYRAVRG